MTDRFFSRIALSIRERSALGAVLHVIDVALCTLSRGRCRLRGYTLIAQAIGIGTLTLTRRHAGTVIQSVTPQHPLARHIPRSDRVNLQRWATGSECLAATVNGNFAGSVWTARTRYIDDEVRCAYELADAVHTVWNFDPYLAPRYRGGGTCTRLWQAVDSHLQAEGIEWSFSRIALLNPASMAAPRRMHAQRVGTAVFLSLGSLQVSLFSISPFVHVGARHHSLPTVRLNVPTTARALNPDPDPSPRPALTSGVAGTAGTAGTAGAAASRGAGALDAPVALVLGLDSHGLAVARALADAGVGVYALEPNPAAPGAASNRVQRWFTLPNYSEEHLLPALRRVRSELRQHARVVLMVINDRQVTAVSHHLRELQSLYAIAWADQAPTS